jgi:hypothetical protein
MQYLPASKNGAGICRRRAGHMVYALTLVAIAFESVIIEF